jgi:hypothetical protein
MSKLRAAGDNLAAKCRLEMAASTFLIANAVLGGISVRCAAPAFLPRLRTMRAVPPSTPTHRSPECPKFETPLYEKDNTWGKG